MNMESYTMHSEKNTVIGTIDFELAVDRYAQRISRQPSDRISGRSSS
jgi:hypothetical protein